VCGSLPPQQLRASQGDWWLRDVVAQLLGWIRGLLVGCAEVRQGVAPYYPQGGPHDTRTLNAGFIRRYSWPERKVLFAELTTGMAALSSFLGTLRDDEWDADSGMVQYRGGSATVPRCVESPMREYRIHSQENLQARPL